MEVQSMSVEELHQLISKDPDLQLIDVRTHEEFSQVHATQAKLLPLSEINPELVSSLDLSLDTPLYFICRSGNRSYYAAEVFAAAGYKTTVNIEGGTTAWLHHNFESQTGFDDSLKWPAAK